MSLIQVDNHVRHQEKHPAMQCLCGKYNYLDLPRCTDRENKICDRSKNIFLRGGGFKSIGSRSLWGRG